MAAFVSLQVAFMVAILRYRLYEIDRLRHQTDLRVVESQLRAVVDRTLQPATCTVWLRRS